MYNSNKNISSTAGCTVDWTLKSPWVWLYNFNWLSRHRFLELPIWNTVCLNCNEISIHQFRMTSDWNSVGSGVTYCVTAFYHTFSYINYNIIHIFYNKIIIWHIILFLWVGKAEKGLASQTWFSEYGHIIWLLAAVVMINDSSVLISSKTKASTYGRCRRSTKDPHRPSTLSHGSQN